MKRTLIKAASTIVVFGLLSGCAAQQTNNSEELAAIKATADQALAEATNASQSATNSLAVANEALDAARQAQSTAESAAQCCADNSKKIDRAFGQAMKK